MTRFQLYSRLGWPQGRSGQVRNTSPPTGIRTPDRSSRSQSLHGLSYPAHNGLVLCSNKTSLLFKGDHTKRVDTLCGQSVGLVLLTGGGVGDGRANAGLRLTIISTHSHASVRSLLCRNCKLHPNNSSAGVSPSWNLPFDT